MEVIELKIGNYIHIPGLFQKSNVVGIVEKITKEEISTDKCEAHISLYQPIPLTEEWLLKFGISSFQDLKVQDSGFLCIESVNDEKILYIIGNDNPTYSSMFKINIKYVHELQNLYFDLTGQELKLKNHDPQDRVKKP